MLEVFGGMNYSFELMKKMGFWILTALVVGNMIGSGIFLLPASLASIGSISLWSWMVTGLGAMFLALVFAKLGALYPKTGGPYIFAREGFGRFIGFQVAYCYWVFMAVGVAAIAIAFTGYLGVFFPNVAHEPLFKFFASAGILWIMTGVNLLGMGPAGITQVVMTILKIVPLLLVTIVGWFFFKSEALPPFNVSGLSNFDALSHGAMLTLWAFLGLESASIPGDEVVNPRRNIPLATLVGTFAVALIYLASTSVIMGVVPMEVLKNSSAPFADLARMILGDWGVVLITCGALASCIGTMNGWILVQNQVALAASRDSVFPRSFSKRTRDHAPYVSLITSSGLITLLLFMNMSKSLVNQFTLIITMATLAAIIVYLYTTVAEVVLLKKRNWTSWVVALIAFGYVFWAIASVGQEIFYWGMLFMLTSIPLYALTRKYYEPEKSL